MDDLLAVTEGAPRRSLAPDEVLLVAGDRVGALFVLVSGSLRIARAGTTIATLVEPGACVGEMSLLLDTPATADVIAATPAVVAVVEDGAALLASDARVALAFARQLAARLQGMTTYLVDLRRQYADHEGGLGMVDVVLDRLAQAPRAATRLGSERDPEPEY